MTALPEWVKEIPCTAGKREPIESERLIKALAIAWEALMPFRENAEWVLENPHERTCGAGCDMDGPKLLITHASSCPIWLAADAMRRIEELGKTE